VRLPGLAYFWIAVEVVAVVAGGFAMSRPVGAYERIDAVLSAVGVESGRYERLAQEDSEALVLIGSLLIGAGILAAAAQQHAAGTRALAAEGGEVVWLEALRREAGPQLRLILESSGTQRIERAAGLERLLLVVGSRMWGGENNRSNARLAYYRFGAATGSGKTLNLERQFPDEANFPQAFVHPNPPGHAVARKRHLFIWTGDFRRIPTLRAGAIVVPVGSPLESQPVQFGLVIVDIPKRRMLRRGSNTSARLLASWLGAADLAARRATR
jgi:hypothetical protein